MSRLQYKRMVDDLRKLLVDSKGAHEVLVPRRVILQIIYALAHEPGYYNPVTDKKSHAKHSKPD